ncbi:hypothetical protein HYPSUDRAFT_205480 [Hypholoma sublateritium FD-334 SS-4]|uniref:Uncharacterized protein n=1 Tax=Hypholoma sublateritium (strain FD-334 SS-4) TaxID=945553 RepID=A0A0D2KUL7_HYPSF|nr:hypothetical protein HYPSUDRAFT_205480 [Hypholoma sublateritium FD-334 SS-4]
MDSGPTRTKRSSLSWEIPPFYDPNNNTATPHPTLPILLAQTEITIHQPPKLLATQEIATSSIAPGPDRHERSRVRFRGSSRGKTPLNRGPSTPPSRSSPAPGGSRARSVSKAPSDHNPQDSESGSESDGLIPKPAGEAGRPSRGGYNLQTELGWPAADYMRFKKFIKHAVKEHLDTSQKFSSQSAESLQTVQALASDKFPSLADYADWWPAADFIRSGRWEGSSV